MRLDGCARKIREGSQLFCSDRKAAAGLDFLGVQPTLLSAERESVLFAAWIAAPFLRGCSNPFRWAVSGLVRSNKPLS